MQYSNRAGIYSINGEFDKAIVDYTGAIQLNTEAGRTLFQSRHDLR